MMHSLINGLTEDERQPGVEIFDEILSEELGEIYLYCESKASLVLSVWCSELPDQGQITKVRNMCGLGMSVLWRTV